MHIYQMVGGSNLLIGTSGIWSTDHLSIYVLYLLIVIVMINITMTTKTMLIIITKQ